LTKIEEERILKKFRTLGLASETDVTLD